MLIELDSMAIKFWQIWHLLTDFPLDPLDNGAQEEVDERMYELSHSRRPQAPLQAGTN